MTSRVVYCISDIHLGGAPASQSSPGFQMCPANSRRRLARFVGRLASAPGNVELVVNGDFIDFLAEENPATGGFAAFTDSPRIAARKLARAIERTDAGAAEGDRVFESFRAFCAAGHRLTILLGNHDIELATPGVRELLRAALTGGKPALYELLYDGQAYRIGGALFEHGNRYDSWNVVFHDDLRRYRSAASREEPVAFRPPPGSELVVQVMNSIKEELRFVDLLKPENEAVLPILAALAPQKLRDIVKVIKLAARSKALQPRRGKPPIWPSAIAGTSPSVDGWNTAITPEQMEISGLQSASMVRVLMEVTKIARKAKDERPNAVREALLGFRSVYRSTFDILVESDQYEEQARRLVAGCDGVVVFGHTHLAKRIPLNDAGGEYMNTGTWCPIIRLPERFYTPSVNEMEERRTMGALRGFLDDLDNNRLDLWCQLRTTATRLVVEDETGRVCERALVEIKDDGESSRFLGYAEP